MPPRRRKNSLGKSPSSCASSGRTEKMVSGLKRIDDLIHQITTSLEGCPPDEADPCPSKEKPECHKDPCSNRSRARLRSSQSPCESPVFKSNRDRAATVACEESRDTTPCTPAPAPPPAPLPTEVGGKIGAIRDILDTMTSKLADYGQDKKTRPAKSSIMCKQAEPITMTSSKHCDIPDSDKLYEVAMNLQQYVTELVCLLGGPRPTSQCKPLRKPSKAPIPCPSQPHRHLPSKPCPPKPCPPKPCPPKSCPPKSCPPKSCPPKSCPPKPCPPPKPRIDPCTPAASSCGDEDLSEMIGMIRRSCNNNSSTTIRPPSVRFAPPTSLARSSLTTGFRDSSDCLTDLLRILHSNDDSFTVRSHYLSSDCE